MDFSQRVESWRAMGHEVNFRSHKIHCYYQEGCTESLDIPLVVLLHGYPTCSYDWMRVVQLLSNLPILTFDMLGFGFSDKPPDHDFSLLWQADLAEELILTETVQKKESVNIGANSEGPAKKIRVFLVAHDMGTSVGCELLARDMEGLLSPGIDLVGGLFFNGNMIMARSSLILGQKLLRSRLGPLAARLSFSWPFIWQLGTVFSTKYPLTSEEGKDQWALMKWKDGHKIMHKLIGYTFERVRQADRWLGAVRNWNKTLSFAWGEQDPVATKGQLEGWMELRPKAPLSLMEEVAHYPHVENAEVFIRSTLEPAIARVVPGYKA